jgi:hypothetical protein
MMTPRKRDAPLGIPLSLAKRPMVKQPEVHIVARLRTPQRVLAAWSPGPSGKDEGGQISYDPSNGTTSRGDIVTFPEGF